MSHRRSWREPDGPAEHTSVMTDEPRYHSSGQFTLDQVSQDQRLGQFSLEDPAMAPLWLVQAALELGALGASLRLGRTQVSLMLRHKGPMAEPEGIARARRIWPELSHSQEGDLCRWVFRRRIGGAQLHREKIWLQQRARFCPIPFKVNGYLLQPENFVWQTHHQGLMPGGYHLAEFYEPGSGVALFRPDGAASGGLINTAHTYWRETPEGVEPLRWWMPWRVAGQVARLKLCQGFRAGWVALLLGEPGHSSQALAVHCGVVVAEIPLDWPELPGLCLIFDASQRPVDLSGLKLVQTLDLQGWLQQRRGQLAEWVVGRLPRWGGQGRGHGVNSRQNRKEAGVLLSIWAGTLLTGVAVYLPLPLLGLPWIVWHHHSRKQIFQRWRERLQELAEVRSEPDR